MPAQLGILPFVIAGAAIAAAGGGAYWWNSNSEYEDWKKTVPAPRIPPAPAAPPSGQTTTWTPAQAGAADRAAWGEWAKNAIPTPPNAPPSEWVIAALAVAAVAGFLLVRK